MMDIIGNGLVAIVSVVFVVLLVKVIFEKPSGGYCDRM